MIILASVAEAVHVKHKRTWVKRPKKILTFGSLIVLTTVIIVLTTVMWDCDNLCIFRLEIKTWITVPLFFSRAA